MSPDRNEGGGGDWVRILREAAPYLSLGTSLAMAILLPIWGGHAVDRRFGTDPWGILVGAVLGLLAAGWQFYRGVVERKP